MKSWAQLGGRAQLQGVFESVIKRDVNVCMSTVFEQANVTALAYLGS
jgi:hypothetical protein